MLYFAEIQRKYSVSIRIIFFDSVVCDPPYGLSKEPNIAEVLTKWLAGEPYDHGHGGFMGKTWDSFVPHPDLWREVFRVLKPGGHALVFAGTRTQDLMTIALRLGGFEIRDVIEWLYFSGFPKSMDVGKAFDKRAGVTREVIGGYKATGTARTITGGNYGGGGNNVAERDFILLTAPATELARQWDGWGTALKPAHEPIIVARKPLAGTVAETVEKYGTGAINIDGCRIGTDEKMSYSSSKAMGVTSFGTGTTKQHEAGRFPANCVTTDDDAFYSPYFNVTPREVCKKASKADRNADWTGKEIVREEKTTTDGRNKSIDNPFLRGETKRLNSHPTVKPTDLMAWLVRLVTPPGGTVLDPFAGSGSTLVAAKREGFGFVGIEREPEYVQIAQARVGASQEAA
jgi:site-specific DNA-methyltransferase (adenine-specific)